MRSPYLPLTLALLACDAAPAPAPPPNPDAAPPAGSHRWSASPGWTFGGSLTAASAGDTAGVLYLEWSTPRTTWIDRLIFQRVDLQGQQRGQPVEVDRADGTLSFGRLALAGDGRSFLACWTQQTRLTCARLTSGAATPIPVFSATGHAPALARAGNTWLLAYGDAARQIVLQRLDDDFTTLGEPRVLPASATADGPREATPALAAVGDTFVLVSGDPVSLRRYDRNLAPVGEAIDLGVSPWSYASVAASATGVVVSVPKPYAATVFLIEGDRVKPFALDGGGKLGLALALASDGVSIGAAWADHQDVRYSDVVFGRTPGLLPRAVLASAQDDRAALLLLRGQPLVLAATYTGEGSPLTVTRP